ncbi:unnamed protein product [Paramecium sonneborni]|uniref:Uncharacterized protein n=1 Tax=Paramecium sonneborni TaxID=65129 RepID=A0A8S1R441_9CILI|nr:unnamed protein product [Paramecium sonneborni]
MINVFKELQKQIILNSESSITVKTLYTILCYFNEEKLKKFQNGITINGIFPHNLCPQNCKSNCNYLHKDWEKKKSLQEKAKDCSIIEFITPEEIFSKDIYDCGKCSHLLNDYCNLLIQGLCRNKKFFKIIKIRKYSQQNELNKFFKILYRILKKFIQFLLLKKEKSKFKLQLMKCNYFAHNQNFFIIKRDIVFIMDLTNL